uniref:Uncharacterized protein n=1 Tax=Timema cristinae TaxID=61476 RepID=A0A7R9HEJ4_TIMCR|nr:unnamed protein product [Timema cristinae]
MIGLTAAILVVKDSSGQKEHSHFNPKVECMEQVDGTLQPATLCDVDYFGLSSPREGRVSNPGTQHLFWNIEGPLRCTQRFVPAANQSVTLTVTRLVRLTPDQSLPHPVRGRGVPLRVQHAPSLSDGPPSAADRVRSDNVVPLWGLSAQGYIILSGNFSKLLAISCELSVKHQRNHGATQEWLPVSVRSWSPVHVIYSVAHYSWTMKGFTFAATYNFHTDGVCGHNILTQQSGE